MENNKEGTRDLCLLGLRVLTFSPFSELHHSDLKHLEHGGRMDILFVVFNCVGKVLSEEGDLSKLQGCER